MTKATAYRNFYLTDHLVRPFQAFTLEIVGDLFCYIAIVLGMNKLSTNKVSVS